MPFKTKQRGQTPSNADIRGIFAKYDPQTEKSDSLICLFQMPVGFFIFFMKKGYSFQGIQINIFFFLSQCHCALEGEESRNRSLLENLNAAWGTLFNKHKCTTGWVPGSDL